MSIRLFLWTKQVIRACILRLLINCRGYLSKKKKGSIISAALSQTYNFHMVFFLEHVFIPNNE